MIKFRLTKKIFLVAVLLNVIALFGFFLFFNKIKSLNVESNFLEKELINKRAKEKEFNFVEENLKEISFGVEKINSYFVPEGKSGVAKFVSDLEKVAHESGVYLKVNSIVLKEQGEGNSFEEMGIGLRIEGSWKKVLSFVKTMTLIPYSITLESLSLNHSSNSGIWRGDLNIKVLKLTDKL